MSRNNPIDTELYSSSATRKMVLDFNTPKKPSLANGQLGINANIPNSGNNEADSLVDLGIQEPIQKLLPRKIPSRFWCQEASPGEIDIGQELNHHSPLWERYQTEAKEHDKILSEGWTGDMDVLLVFVGF